MKKRENKKDLIISYMTLRWVIGLLGMLLPFVLWLGAQWIFGEGIQPSISAYYHTRMRNVMVGTLWAIGVFLFAYKGYARIDDILGDLACLFAIGVALVPTAPIGNTDPIVERISTAHLTLAALFFLTLTYFCLFLFVKTDKKDPDARKLQRNIVYRVCGGVMLACILLMGLYNFLPEPVTAPYASLNPIFWLEALAIFAFGVSWFVKGEAILKDIKRPGEKARA